MDLHLHRVHFLVISALIIDGLRGRCDGRWRNGGAGENNICRKTICARQGVETWIRPCDFGTKNCDFFEFLKVNFNLEKIDEFRRI